MQNNKVKFISGAVSLIYLATICIFSLFLGGNYQYSHSWPYWGIFMALVVTSVLFYINARRFMTLVFETSLENHFEVVTRSGVTIYGYEIRESDKNTIVIKQKEVWHRVSKEDIKYIESIAEFGYRKKSSVESFIKEFIRGEDDV